MKITKQWLKKQKFCTNDIWIYNELKETDSLKLLQLLIKFNNDQKIYGQRIEFAQHLLTKMLDDEQKIQYTIYCIKQIEPFYTKEFRDWQLYDSICILEEYVKNPTEKKLKQLEIIKAHAPYIASKAHSMAHCKTWDRKTAIAVTSARIIANAINNPIEYSEHIATITAIQFDNYIKTLKDIVEYGITLL